MLLREDVAQGFQFIARELQIPLDEVIQQGIAKTGGGLGQATFLQYLHYHVELLARELQLHGVPLCISIMGAVGAGLRRENAAVPSIGIRKRNAAETVIVW